MCKQIIYFYDFDIFRVDVQNRSLSRKGGSVSIPPRTFDLLLVLVEHRNRAVSKNELMEKLWSSDADPNNVDQHISKLRDILGGESRLKNSVQRYRYIKTIPREGFKFQREVTEIYGNTELPEQPQDLHAEALQTIGEAWNFHPPPSGKRIVRLMAVVAVAIEEPPT